MDPDTPSSSSALNLFHYAAGIAFEPTIVIVQVLVFLLLLLASALFSGSEVALFSLDGTDKEELAQAKDRASQRVLQLLEQPRQLLITILILNTLVNVSAAIIAALLTAQLAVRLGWSHGVTFVLEVIALTFVLLVVSEITPKLIASRQAPSFSRRVSGLLLILHHLCRPLSRGLAHAMSGLQNRLKPVAVRRLSPDDLKAMAAIGEAHGTLEEEERELINSIVEFGETTVREIMVSRVDVVALPVTATLPEALEVIRESGHSRMPLYVEHLDNILGIVYAKDLLPYLRQSNGTERIDWTRIARPPFFVPLGKKLDDLLKDLQAKRMHIAIVVDEYGGTAGLVTLEDVLEEIVGDIRDEHDEPEDHLYEYLEPNVYRFDARINLDDLNELLGLTIETEDFDFETLGGLIFHLTGAIPSEGDEITHGALHMRVESVDSRRIGYVRVEVEEIPAAGEEITEKGAAENN